MVVPVAALVALTPLAARSFGVRMLSECNVNGFGMGRCDFTNSGWWEGHQCVTVTVSDRRGLGQPVSSEPVCSGEVGRHQTINVAFSLSGVDRLCRPSAADISEGGPGRKRWDEYCAVRTEPVVE